MKNVRSLALAFALIAAGQAQAQGEIVGVGMNNCAEWLDARADMARTGGSHEYGYMISWVQGYLSALNRDRSMRKLKPVPIPAVSVLSYQLDNNCRAKPASYLANEALAIYAAQLP